MRYRKGSRWKSRLKDLVIVDGYNFIFNFVDKSGIDNEELMHLRESLINDLVQYSARKDRAVIIVFDGSSQARSYEKVNKIEVVYSRKNETADSIIEEMVKKYSRDRKVFVVTSDYLQQKVVLGKNTYRKSSREFGIEINEIKKRTGEAITKSREVTDKRFYQLGKRLGVKTGNTISKLRKE